MTQPSVTRISAAAPSAAAFSSDIISFRLTNVWPSALCAMAWSTVHGAAWILFRFCPKSTATVMMSSMKLSALP